MAGVLACVMSCVPLAAVQGQSATQGPPPAKVRLDEVRLEPVEQLRRVTGEMRALQRSALATQEAGLVLSLEVRQGERVRAGQVIARLDDERQRLATAQIQAELEALQATVAERDAEFSRAQTELGRMRSLRERQSASVQELDDAELVSRASEARLARARADVAAAAQALELARKRVRDMTVAAPFDARVVAVLAEQGEWVATGDAVVELYATGSIEAWIDVPERFIGRLSGSAEAVLPSVGVIIEALGEQRMGEIIEIVPDADPQSRLFPVRIRVPDPEGDLRPGMSVIAEVPTGSSAQTLTVHKDAILRNDAGEFVYAALPSPMGPPGGLAGIPMQISRLFAVGERVAIRPGGLAPGMRVVTEGNERMFPTQPLDVQDQPGEASVSDAGGEG
jgi:RND family efflux transporter MFP subunit